MEPRSPTPPARALVAAMALLPQLTGCATSAGASLGTGVAVVSTSVAGRTEQNIGPLLSLQFGTPAPGQYGAFTDFVIQPFRAHNPVIDESYRSLYVLPSYQIGLDALRLRFGLGVGSMIFGGVDSLSGDELGPAATVSFGAVFPGPLRRLWAVDVSLLGAGTPDGELGSAWYALRVSLPFGLPRTTPGRGSR